MLQSAIIIMAELIKPSGVSETRNSLIRQKTAHLTSGLANILDRTIPGLTPTHLNIIGVLFVTAGSAIAASYEKMDKEKAETALAATLITVGSALDGIDGPLARIKAQIDPKSIDFNKGQIYDAIGDRSQEVVEAISRGVRAHNRGDRFGELVAFTSAVTNTLPSIIRASAEVSGKPVPETGKGILGLIGTRVGRATLGILATVAPEINGVTIQPAVDALMTVSNVKTALDRLGTTKSDAERTLPHQVREDAKDRLKALSVFGILATVTTLLTYWRLNRVQRTKEAIESLRGDDGYTQIIYEIQNYCEEMGLEHRFVGGTLTDLIGPKTEYELDISSKRIKLRNPNTPSLIRSDGTVKDVDLVMFSPDIQKYQAAKQKFKEWGTKAKKEGKPFPYISIEAARHPGWPERNRLQQFVTVFEYDHNGQPHLTFGSTDQPINPDSLNPWTIDVGNGVEITTFNPIAHILCYALRVPSGVKKKDRVVIGSYDGSGERQFNKLGMIGRLAHDVLVTGREEGIDYKNDSYREWINYIHTLSRNPDLLIGTKAIITRLYWDTIGTQVSHGVGIFKRLSTLSDRFTG